MAESIYDVNVLNFDKDYTYETDIKAIAHEVAERQEAAYTRQFTLWSSTPHITRDRPSKGEASIARLNPTRRRATFTHRCVPGH